jgi:hypothetical protein
VLPFVFISVFVLAVLQERMRDLWKLDSVCSECSLFLPAVLIDLNIELLDLIIKTFDNHAQS